MASSVTEDLARDGVFFVAGDVTRSAFDRLVERLGAPIAEERIALRPGAHAYVAKAGRVPLHTDHPDVDFVAWRCVEQDRDDGASLLLDTRSTLHAMRRESPVHFEKLFDTSLVCPPLSAGPPTLLRPVLRKTGSELHLFCSPWLRAADDSDGRGAALEELRERLSHAARTECVSRRMQRGGVVIVDNRRVLHGRAPIAEDSQRRLDRVWIARW